MIISRYLSDARLVRMKNDFAFLFEMFPDFHGEMDLALRGTYFNIYYRGNSLAKVVFSSDDTYQVEISTTFYNNSKSSTHASFKGKEKSTGKNRTVLTIERKKLYPFFQKAHLKDFGARIKAVGYGEEIMLEQAIITDNRDREDLVIIDRQIQDTQWKERMDLLALQQVEGVNYRFRIMEVKLGNNKELTGDVAEQLQKYVDHVTRHFADYKACYEKVYQQRKALGLHSQPAYPSINIQEPVEGSVVVLGYSGLATKSLALLRPKYPAVHVRQFDYHL